MQGREVFAHPIRSFRTAPLGYAVTGFVSIPTSESLLDPNVGSYNFLAALAVEAAGVYAGGWLAARQFRLRTRLEASFEAHGFDERIVETTAEEWCARQTTLVTCEQYGARQDCEEYYAGRSGAMQFPWLPHF